ncbi:family 43 glycosylhydrolase [Segetibacter sp. 3557_3]|uniref:family 43 glycosylhydrolase n=1 Tax=Segetibacter sp. 3557_3 TaxID=2547429 RepID=UPI001A9EEF11|nr:family 43 glycosylhydrolase [Segetibacter sp. 3557_3]
MKKGVTIFVLLVNMVLFGTAQPPAGGQGLGQGAGQQAATPEVRAQRTLDGPGFASLNLTPDQKTKVLAILVGQNKALDALNATIPADAADRPTQLAALQPKRLEIMQANEKNFIKVLNASQKTAYDVIAKARPATQGFGQVGGGRGGLPVGSITTTPDVHDPVMAKEGDTYYVFYTGGGVWSSKDMTTWKKEPPVFDAMPAWVREAGIRAGSYWAPDITFHNGLWYLYYCVSSFGANSSAIGVATNKTLDRSSPDYKWVDLGKVVQSVTGRDMWNAIDPNLAFDETGTPWLNFGSWWNGIKLVKLNPDLKSIAQPEKWSTIASRGRDILKTPDDKAGERPHAIEGSFIFKKDKYYYLFTSWGRCCTVFDSVTYNIRVGRSEKITGPYLDKDGVDLAKGGGTLVLGGDSTEPRVIAALGHNSAYTFDGVDYLVYHAYTRQGNRLGIDKLAWDNGWPVVPPKRSTAQK